MERQFIKRNTKNQKLLAGGSLSPIVLDYIMDSEVPKPCRHFIGRDKELEELYTMLEENRHVFLCGIAGIGKSELAKAYAKRYIKQYTNILYVEYTGIFIRILLTWILLTIRRKALTRNVFKDITVFCVP